MKKYYLILMIVSLLFAVFNIVNVYLDINSIVQLVVACLYLTVNIIGLVIINKNKKK